MAAPAAAAGVAGAAAGAGGAGAGGGAGAAGGAGAGAKAGGLGAGGAGDAGASGANAAGKAAGDKGSQLEAARRIGRAANQVEQAAGNDAEGKSRARRLLKLAAFGAGLLVITPVLLICMVLISAFTLQDRAGANPPATTTYPPGSGIPEVYWPIYVTAASHYTINPYLLASIHMQETTFSSDPSARAGFNSSGCCGGPMQFKPSTWVAYKDAFRPIADQRPGAYPLRREELASCASVPEGTGCMYDDFDAIAGAAMMLHSNGADTSLASSGTREAVCSYIGHCAEVDHCTGSINQYCGVIPRAKRWESSVRTWEPPTNYIHMGMTPGSKAKLLPNGLAQPPENAPPAVRKMIEAANSISDKPYEQVHYPTHIGNRTYDCSSSTSHVLWAGGKFGTAPWCSANFVGWGEPGPGKWVTVYARGPCGSSGHVFMIIAGLRFDTSRVDNGPNAGERGPRWRTGRTDLGTFVARHPEGL